MNQSTLEYLRSIKPSDHKNGMEILREGIEMGKSIELGKTKFREANDGMSFLQFKKKAREEGRTLWNVLAGLATLQEEVELIAEFYRWSRENNIKCDIVQSIASGVVALPKEYRDKAPSTTSYVMDGVEDYKAQMDASPMMVSFGDYILSSPNAIETTKNSILSGCELIGEFSQIIWDYTGYSDNLQRCSDVVRAVGMCAAKYDQDVMVQTYLDDGIPGYCLDCTSYVAYAMLEHHIVSKLCGARYIVSFGGLISEAATRAGIAMAIDKALSTEDQPALHYMNSSTNLQWDHDIHGNYGMSVKEFLFEILMNKKFNLGICINPVSITEKIAVPTMRELMDIFAAGSRTEEDCEEWLPFMDFSELETMRDVMTEKAQLMFANTLEALEAAGFDINDPLEMSMFIHDVNPMMYEEMFHPSTYNEGKPSVQAYYPTVLARQTMEIRDGMIEEARAEGLEGCLNGKKIVTVSGDAHTYGLKVVEGMLQFAGASIVNGGVDMSAADVLDLADEEDSVNICISCHNGQCLGYAKLLKQLAAERGRSYNVFMGGKLNAILPGASEPCDVSDMLTEMGIDAGNDMISTIRKLRDL